MKIKHLLREEIKADIAALDAEYVKDADAAIARHILASAEYASAKTVFIYVGIKEEIATLPVIEAALEVGKQLCVPLTHSGGLMDAVAIRNVSELVVGNRGLLEPLSAPYSVVAPESIDLALVPCLSCDPFGNRIGYGGGYYDRYLKLATKTHKFALVRSAVLRMHLPRGENDVPMDGFISERGLTLAR